MILLDGGKKRGKQAERDVMMACQAVIPTLSWAGQARYATRDEDRRGIDIVVASDRGELFLQVKASRTRGKWKRNGVVTALVIANPLKGLDKRTRHALVGLYERMPAAHECAIAEASPVVVELYAERMWNLLVAREAERPRNNGVAKLARRWHHAWSATHAIDIARPA
jgi:hypothetical protein